MPTVSTCLNFNRQTRRPCAHGHGRAGVRGVHAGHVQMPLADMFWGDCFGSLRDRFGVQWMFNCSEKKNA